MDFNTARRVLAIQTLPEHETNDTFLGRLRMGQPPVPGQVTTILLALSVVHATLKTEVAIGRELAQSLFLVAYESRNLFEAGRGARVPWPPLLDEDLERIAIATYQIFANEPVEET